MPGIIYLAGLEGNGKMIEFSMRAASPAPLRAEDRLDPYAAALNSCCATHLDGVLLRGAKGTADVRPLERSLLFPLPQY